MSRPEYEIVLGSKFVEDLQRLAADARRDPTGRGAFLRQQVLAQIKGLTEGRTDGHHPLGYEAGKGDLRDCVTCYMRSDPQKAADHRLVFGRWVLRRQVSCPAGVARGEAPAG